MQKLTHALATFEETLKTYISPERQIKLLALHGWDVQMHLLGCEQELDPLGKFASMSNVWSWRATREGQDVPLTQCCTPNGFSTDCLCAKRLSCSS